MAVATVIAKPRTNSSASISRCRRRWADPGLAGRSTPEHLFAAGYAACFNGALDFVASSKKKNAKGAVVTCAVGIGPREAGGFGINVKMRVEDPTLPQAELEQFVHETHEKICPYSHATRGNIAIEFEVKGA